VAAVEVQAQLLMAMVVVSLHHLHLVMGMVVVSLCQSNILRKRMLVDLKYVAQRLGNLSCRTAVAG
jgi:hypothetical protein